MLELEKLLNDESLEIEEYIEEVYIEQQNGKNF